MATADPGLALATAPAEDPPKTSAFASTAIDDSDRPIAPDQFDPKYTADRLEIWSYYSYYMGDNGTGPFNFAPTAFQNLLYQAAGDSEFLYFAGQRRTINAIVLLSNGISFAIQAAIFLVLGSLADFGHWRPNILIVLSLLSWGVGFSWLGVHDASKWEAATALYIIGLIGYQTTLTFFTAAFPGLARNTPELRHKAEQYQAGEITRDEYDYADMMKRSELSNVSFFVQSITQIIQLVIIIGTMFALDVNASTANNNLGLSALIAFATGWWILVAIPWFVKEKRRPGKEIPANMNIFTVGFQQLYIAASEIWQLKQSLIYLIGYFLLGDSLNTTVTVISTLQNTLVSYNSLQSTYLLLVGIVFQAIGIWAFWTIQKRWELSTKTMFDAVAFFTVGLDVWGLIGIWTTKFGFHNVWELWVYQVYYSLLVCPWYSYSQIMISEVTPRGREFLFFSLFGVIGKTSSFVGPLVGSKIIDDSGGNNSTPFYFLLAVSLVSFVWLYWLVDLKKSRIEQAEFLEREERKMKEKIVSGKDSSGNEIGVEISSDSRSESLTKRVPDKETQV